MKKKLVTLLLAAVMAGTFVLAVFSYENLEHRLHMQDQNQNTMETLEEAEPEIQMKITEAPIRKEEETEETDEISDNPYAPVLTLSSKQLVIWAGEDFNVISPVDDVTDDLDDRYSLFHNIQVQGEYDINKPGQYTLVYTAMDSSGNVSAPKKLTLIVKSR